MRTRLFPSAPPPARFTVPRALPTPEPLRRVGRRIRYLRYSPALHWCAAALLAFLTLSTATGRRAELERRLGDLGPTVRVAVTRAPVRAGASLGSDDVRWRSVPKGLVPADAVRHLDRSRRVAVDLGAGEVIRRDRLRPFSGSALAAAIPRGSVAVAVPLPPGLRPEHGDRVELLSIDASGISSTIALDAAVVDRHDGAAVVAVPRRRAGAVADAVLASTLTVAIAGP